MKKCFRKLGESWGKPFVARREIEKFSGGQVSPKTLSNHDAAGTGPEGRMRFGKRIVYDTEALCEWMDKQFVELN